MITFPRLIGIVGIVVVLLDLASYREAGGYLVGGAMIVLAIVFEVLGRRRRPTVPPATQPPVPPAPRP